MINVRVESNLSELEKDIKYLEGKIYVAKTNIPKWEEELETMKKEYEESNWMKTDHTKVFDGLEFCANYNTWEETKSKYQKEPHIGVFCFVDLQEDDGISVSKAKDLVKYLQQKIDYLEEN